jgi:hypothetical protein
VLHVLVSREEWRPGDERWHISISGPGRVPTWSEIAETCHELRPGVPFVLGVPPRSMWMNVHKDVLHALETKDDAMLEQWRECDVTKRLTTPTTRLWCSGCDVSVTAEGRLKHREFPESTYGYVAFRADKADAARFGRHIYSTSYHDLDEMRDRRKSFRANSERRVAAARRPL